jgi:hypothetical protein
MATTTTNYGFDVPTSSDLVKNGATQIALLGQDIDTFLFRPFSKNVIINGAMDFWQRGTSYALPAAVFNYGAADRWGVYANSVTGRTISRQTAGLAGFTYSQRVQRDSGNTNTQNTQLVQIIESPTATSLQGQFVTVSFWAKAGANYSVSSSNITVVLYAGTGTDQNPYTSGYTGQTTPISTSQAITTSWARYSFTTSAALASTVTELTLAIQSGAFIGTAGANDWFEVTGVQVESGSQATPFTRAAETLQGELAACQRYYYRTTANAIGIRFGYGTNISTTAAQIMVTFPVQMRSVPTALEQSGTSTDYSITEPAGATAACTSVPTFLNATLINSITTLTSTDGTLTQYRASSARGSALTAYLGWSAEL